MTWPLSSTLSSAPVSSVSTPKALDSRSKRAASRSQESCWPLAQVTDESFPSTDRPSQDHPGSPGPQNTPRLVVGWKGKRRSFAEGCPDPDPKLGGDRSLVHRSLSTSLGWSSGENQAQGRRSPSLHFPPSTDLYDVTPARPPMSKTIVHKLSWSFSHGLFHFRLVQDNKCKSRYLEFLQSRQLPYLASRKELSEACHPLQDHVNQVLTVFQMGPKSNHKKFQQSGNTCLADQYFCSECTFI